jgi:hypothetical protein
MLRGCLKSPANANQNQQNLDKIEAVLAQAKADAQ